MVQGSSEQDWYRSPGEVRGASVGAGYSRGAAGGRIPVAPVGREGPARLFLVPGLGRTRARAGTKWTESVSLRSGLLHRAPLAPAAPALHLARCHSFSVKATGALQGSHISMIFPKHYFPPFVAFAQLTQDPIFFFS